MESEEEDVCFQFDLGEIEMEDMGDMSMYGVLDAVPDDDDPDYEYCATERTQSFAAALMSPKSYDHVRKVKIEGMSHKLKMMYAAAYDVLSEEYGVQDNVDVEPRLGVEDLARLTPQLFETISQEEDEFVAVVGHVGAVTAQSYQLENMSVWNGETFKRLTGDGSFEVHGISAKIDGYPVIPVRIANNRSVRSYCWMYTKLGYRLKRMNWLPFERMEYREGVIYTPNPASEEIRIGGIAYEVVATPVLPPTDIEEVLKMLSVSDGIVLHSGIYEYKIKYCRTVDLIVENMQAFTSDQVKILDAVYPHGVYEFDLETGDMIRSRLDKYVPNSSKTVRQVRNSAVVGDYLRAVRVDGIHILSSKDRQILYSGQGINVGVQRVEAYRECTVAETKILDEVPAMFRVHVRRHGMMNVRYLKTLLALRGYVMINHEILWVQDAFVRREIDPPWEIKGSQVLLVGARKDKNKFEKLDLSRLEVYEKGRTTTVS